jgi:hypothetical protein
VRALNAKEHNLGAFPALSSNPFHQRSTQSDEKERKMSSALAVHTLGPSALLLCGQNSNFANFQPCLWEILFAASWNKKLELMMMGGKSKDPWARLPFPRECAQWNLFPRHMQGRMRRRRFQLRHGR